MPPRDVQDDLIRVKPRDLEELGNRRFGRRDDRQAASPGMVHIGGSGALGQRVGLTSCDDSVPVPVVTVPPGVHIVVIVPRWGWGTATDVDVAHSGILRGECNALLPGGGRRTIFLAAGQGSTRVGATVQPASNLFVSAWGGEVIVRGSRD